MEKLIRKIDSQQINNTDNRIITINEYNPDKKYDISVYKFSDLLNSFVTSKNALEICNSIGCNSIEIQQKSLEYGLTYKNVFNGDNNSAAAKKVLDIIKCDIKPKTSSKTFKSISYIKWKIIEFNKKIPKTDEIAEWIGLLAGLVLYFDELDELNYNTTTYAKDICIPLTVELL
jgi:hypothetical protein